MLIPPEAAAAAAEEVEDAWTPTVEGLHQHEL